MIPRRLTATYRVQFTKEFTFDDACRLVPYWADLGVSHLHASPIFRAQPGSPRGYDIIDHDAINPELGGEAGLLALVNALHAAGLGLIIGIVPNHAGIAGTANMRWQDVLEFGRRSRHAGFFDIQWDAGPLALPVLERPLEALIASGELQLAADLDGPRLVALSQGHQFPLRPQTVARLLTRAHERSGNPLFSETAASWAELENIRAAAAGRQLKRERLRRLLRDPAAMKALEAVLREENIGAVLAEQHYRLVPWREGARTLNYRRFFDIADLAELRVEDPAVFDVVHRLPIALIAEGHVDGLRVERLDGLADPALYCDRLRSRIGPAATLHIEKILGAKEELRDWPVNGTTGYELLNLINGLFVEPEGYSALADALGLFGFTGTVAERIVAAKKAILVSSFTAELNFLARRGTDLSRRAGHPVRLGTMHEIISALIAALPVYRTYITAVGGNAQDLAILVDAAKRASLSLSRGAKRALTTLIDILLAPDKDEESLSFVRRFQQLSSAAMAKGYEDTELYRYPALVSVNEVGSHLTEPTVDIQAFHQAVAKIADGTRRALLPLSTHDTKRGADTRARLNVLSEMASDWLEATERWHARHAPLIGLMKDGAPAPDALDESFIYQTLFGAWPLNRARLRTYLVKALREAKRHTSWLDPNENYETHVLAFAAMLVEGAEGEDFRRELQAFLEVAAPAGHRNSLSQMVLQLTLPAISDIYQGDEFYEFLLADPDNRRPVDWEKRSETLGRRVEEGADWMATGVAKQWTLSRLLALRREDPTLLLKGSYGGLSVTGGSEVLAFLRQIEERTLVVVLSTRALACRRGEVVIDLGLSKIQRWRSIAGARDARQEGRLLRIGREFLPTVVLGTPK